MLELVFESRACRGEEKRKGNPGGRENICKAIEQSQVKDKEISLHEPVNNKTQYQRFAPRPCSLRVLLLCTRYLA